MRVLASFGVTGRSLVASAAAFVLIGAGCGGDGGGVPGDALPCTDESPYAPSVECRVAGACPQIQVSGDAPATTPGVFKGFADPAVAQDPDTPGRLWLAYSWPHILTGQAPDGTTALMAAVSTHLARSDDSGLSFSYVSEPWPAVRAPDPEGSGENGVVSSETPSLVAMASDGEVTWYGAHLRYFLRPETGYHPNYATSWHVRIGAAPSPPDLAFAEETVLGVSATADVYRPDARLDELGLLVGVVGLLVASAPVLGVVAGARVHLDEVPVVAAVGLEGGLCQALGRPLAGEIVPPAGHGDAVDVVAAEGGGDSFRFRHGSSHGES